MKWNKRQTTKTLFNWTENDTNTSENFNSKQINRYVNVNFMQNLQEIMWLKTENECVRDTPD